MGRNATGAQKVSISLDASTLKWMRSHARRRGESLSAAFAEAARLLRQQEAREKLLAYLGDAADTTPEQTAAIRAEWEA